MDANVQRATYRERHGRFKSMDSVDSTAVVQEGVQEELSTKDTQQEDSAKACTVASVKKDTRK